MAKILGQHIPTEVRNLAINGALDFWQRVEGSTVTVNTSGTAANYAADMCHYTMVGGTTKNFSVVRSTDIPSLVQSGFQSTYSWLFTMITGIATPAAGDGVVPFSYRLEGLDYEKIHTKNVTFGFWIKTSIAGTYCFALQNSAANRSYVTTFSVNGSAVWQYVSVNVTLDNTGTWAFDNTIGLQIYVGSVTGSTFQAPTLNAWQAGGFSSSSTATNWQATTGATFQIAQFSIVEGPLGFSATGFARQGRTVGQELAMCQRYYEKSYDIGTALASATLIGMNFSSTGTTGNFVATTILGKATKRATPTLQYWDGAGNLSKFSTFSSGAWAQTNNVGALTEITANLAGLLWRASVTNTAPGIHWAADAGL